MAMVSLTACTLLEETTRTMVPQQLGPHAGDVAVAVGVITLGFLLQAANGATVPEEPLDVLGAPGWTLETEILHGRLAMLAFAYVLVAEGLYGHPVLGG